MTFTLWLILWLCLVAIWATTMFPLPVSFRWRRAIALVLAGGLVGSACALTTKSPTQLQQADARRQIADVVERLTLAENLAASALETLKTSPVSPELKIAIGCDVLKAVGQDAPSTTVTNNCGSIPTRAASPLHLAVKTAQELGTCASRQQTIAVALQLAQPLWERLERTGVLALQVLGGSLKFTLQPLQTISCGGVA